MPVHAPVAGVIEELLVEDGSTVTPGMSICKLRVGGNYLNINVRISNKNVTLNIEILISYFIFY